MLNRQDYRILEPRGELRSDEHRRAPFRRAITLVLSPRGSALATCRRGLPVRRRSLLPPQPQGTRLRVVSDKKRNRYATLTKRSADLTSATSGRNGAVPALVPLQKQVYRVGLRFPETATTSLGILQPWPLPSSKLASQKPGSHDRIAPSIRTACRTAATSPRRIPRHAGAQINQAGGHTVLWGSTLSVRRDAQGARDGKLSVPSRRWRAVDHVRTSPIGTACRAFLVASFGLVASLAA